MRRRNKIGPVWTILAFVVTLLVIGCGRQQEASPRTHDVAKSAEPKTESPSPNVDPTGRKQKGIDLRFELPPNKPVRYELSSKMFVSETKDAAEVARLEMTSTTVAVQTAKAPDREGVFEVQVRFENPRVTVSRGGQKDPAHAKLVEDRLRQETQSYRFDRLGRLHLGGEQEVPFEIGLNGLVFPEHPVEVGDTWTHSTKLNLEKMVDPGAPLVPVTASFRLLEVAERDGIRQAKVAMRVESAVAERSRTEEDARYSGSIGLEETAWIEVGTGMVVTATSKIDIKVSKVRGDSLHTYIRTAEQQMTRKL